MAMIPMTRTEVALLNAHFIDTDIDESAADTTLRVARNVGLTLKESYEQYWLFVSPATGRWVYGWSCGGFSLGWGAA